LQHGENLFSYYDVKTGKFIVSNLFHVLRIFAASLQ